MVDSITTAAREAIRIADAYLPEASIQRRKELAIEIVKAINLCEDELANEIIARVRTDAARARH